MDAERPYERGHFTDQTRGWRAGLPTAFAALLGRPLDAFAPTATYALYHWDDELSAEFFEFFPGTDALLTVATSDPEAFDEEYPLSWTHWQLDLARSLFLLDGDVPPQVAALSLDPSAPVVTGTDLARLLAAGHAAPDDLTMTVLARVAGDGTLFDAMRAATWTGGNLSDLADFRTGAEAEPRWDAALAAVDHPVLRDHLRMLCLAEPWSRSDGARYLGAGDCPPEFTWLAERPSHTLLAAWEFGESQASSAVFRIGG
ncbi:hypothetical protein [Yinghuangia soli]|uniref:DUF1963 domain-containing protein n=1 Tax=Yinghuangia soli TaxID=2908204 RepID=A0AA41Q8F2_9ACTN|nr:hypothetical protein [Yinghuangia soli]MCF2533524.1 hypothetical protein [Yinghuangia soli]